MKEEKKTWVWVGVIVVVVGLMMWGARSQQANAGTWQDTDIACLGGGHQAAVQHIHTNVAVTVDGEERSIPSSVGINNSCMAEVHTHNASGEIHVESADTNAELTLSDFMAVWGAPFASDDYEREVVVNGQPYEQDSYVFTDGDTVEVSYRSVAGTSTAATSSATSSDSEE